MLTYSHPKCNYSFISQRRVIYSCLDTAVVVMSLGMSLKLLYIELG